MAHPTAPLEPTRKPANFPTLQAQLNPPLPVTFCQARTVSPAALAHGFVELIYREEGNAEDACIDRDDHQNDLQPVHRTPPIKDSSAAGRKRSLRPTPAPRWQRTTSQPPTHPLLA